VLALRSFHCKYNTRNTFIFPQILDFQKEKRGRSTLKNENRGYFHTPSVSSVDSFAFSAPSSTPLITVEYYSGQSFSSWLKRCRCALSSRMTCGLKYRSTGSPHTLISCMITGRLRTVPSFSIFSRYRESMLPISAVECCYMHYF
jgi:hypothetical protein